MSASGSDDASALPPLPPPRLDGSNDGAGAADPDLWDTPSGRRLLKR